VCEEEAEGEGVENGGEGREASNFQATRGSFKAYSIILGQYFFSFHVTIFFISKKVGEWGITNLVPLLCPCLESFNKCSKCKVNLIFGST
jgi:hypothetical protein